MRLTRMAAILTLAAWGVVSRAVELQVTSSTQYLWYQDFLSGEKDQKEAAEYLRLKLGNLDKQGNVTVYGYGRAIRQLSSDAEPVPEIGHKTAGRLYYLYVDYRNVIKDHLDVKLGRTYVSNAAVPGVVDGLYLNARNLGALGVTAFGGRRVVFDKLSETGGWGDQLAGGSVYVDLPRNTHAEVSFAATRVDYQGETLVGREMLGVDVNTTPHQRLNLVGQLRYDLVSSRYSEILAQANVTPWTNLVLGAEYFTSNPVFDQYSFYRFFHVDSYQELGANAEYRLNDNYRVHARYATEDFNRGSSAHVVGAGVFARPFRSLTLDLSYDYRSGFADRLSGFRVSGAYRLLGATLLAGADYDDFRREAARTGTAKRYWGGVDYDFNKLLGASFRISQNVNFNFSSAYQGYVALNVHI